MQLDSHTLVVETELLPTSMAFQFGSLYQVLGEAFVTADVR